MKRICLFNLVFCCLLLFFPLRSSAFLGFDYGITGSVSTAYDDNVTFVKEEKKSDYVTNLRIGLGAKQEGKTDTLAIAGSFTQHLFADYSSFDNNSQNIDIDYKKELSRYDRFFVTNKFVHAEEPGSFEDDFGRTSGGYSYYRNIFDMGYAKDLSKQFYIQGRYGNESYSAQREDIRDSLLHRVGFEAHYIQSSATDYLLGYDFVTRHFDAGGTASVHTVATGFRHFLTSQLYVDTRAGVSLVEAFAGSNSFEPSVFVALTNDFNATDSASVSYRKTSMPSSFTADIFDSWRVAVSLSRQLLERLKVSMEVFWGEGDFKAQSIIDEQRGVNAQLSYDVSEDAAAFMAFTYSEVDSNIDTRSYARNLIDAGVRISF